MRIRTVLRLVATGAAGWAVAVSGVKDNPQFAAFLALVALIAFVSAENYGALSKKRRALGWRFDGPFIALMALVVTVGGYLAVRYHQPDSNTVDEHARTLGQTAHQQVGNLRTDLATRSGELSGEIAALRAEVRAAMQFQDADRVARENAQKQEELRGDRHRAVMARLGSELEQGRALLAAVATEAPAALEKKRATWGQAVIDTLIANGFEGQARVFNTGVAAGAMPRLAQPEVREGNLEQWQWLVVRVYSLAAIISDIQQSK